MNKYFTHILQDSNKTPSKQHNYNIHSPSPPTTGTEHSNYVGRHAASQHHDVITGRNVTEYDNDVMKSDSYDVTEPDTSDALGLTEDEFTSKFLPATITTETTHVHSDIPEVICH